MKKKKILRFNSNHSLKLTNNTIFLKNPIYLSKKKRNIQSRNYRNQDTRRKRRKEKILLLFLANIIDIEFLEKKKIHSNNTIFLKNPIYLSKKKRNIQSRNYRNHDTRKRRRKEKILSRKYHQYRIS